MKIRQVRSIVKKSKLATKSFKPYSKLQPVFKQNIYFISPNFIKTQFKNKVI